VSAVDTTVLIYAYRENLRWACDSTSCSSFQLFHWAVVENSIVADGENVGA